jgi:polyhydroxyalkanoate synthesis regulator phasin
MNPDNLPQMLQTGFHLTLGATSFLLETLQDPQKREENLDKLRQPDLGLLADELLEKGEMTDREARNFVDTIFSGPGDRENARSEESGSPQQSDTATDTPPESVVQPDVKLEIQELTAQMAALRAELENLRAENSHD